MNHYDRRRIIRSIIDSDTISQAIDRLTEVPDILLHSGNHK